MDALHPSGSLENAGWPERVLIVGCGNMGGAMLTGWLRAGMAAQRFTVVDPYRDNLPVGVSLLRDIPGHDRAYCSGDPAYNVILLAVKPQGLSALAPALAPLAGPNCLLVSLLAGVERASIMRHFPDAGAVIRIMPNLAVAIGKSPIGVVAGGLPDILRKRVDALLSPLGHPEWLEREDMIHALTALAGSGPAFVYRFIDALASAGEALGLERSQAERLALTMVQGSGLLASASNLSPGELAQAVASPGGTTEAGLKVLDDHHALASLVAKTLSAARDRSISMSREAR